MAVHRKTPATRHGLSVITSNSVALGVGNHKMAALVSLGAWLTQKNTAVLARVSVLNLIAIAHKIKVGV